MKWQILTLVLTFLILLSVGGIVSVVSAASHENPKQVSKPDVKAASCNFVGSCKSNVYHYPSCGYVKNIKPGNIVCFDTPCDAVARGIIHVRSVSPQRVD